jgi:two-component system OmpR family response regulator
MVNKPFNILLVEDDEDLRDSVLLYLSSAGFSVSGVGSAQDFYLAIRHASFDVVVLDIGLPDQSGMVLADYVRGNTQSGIVILSAHSELEHRVRGYSYGADLYLIKPVMMEELTAAITSMAQRRANRFPAVAADSAMWTLYLTSWKLISPSGVEIALTGKEFALLKILGDAAGEQVPRRQLMALLKYPENDDGTGRALDNLLLRLRRKVREQTGAESPINTYHGAGYCFSGAMAYLP